MNGPIRLVYYEPDRIVAKYLQSPITTHNGTPFGLVTDARLVVQALVLPLMSKTEEITAEDDKDSPRVNVTVDPTTEIRPTVCLDEQDSLPGQFHFIFLTTLRVDGSRSMSDNSDSDEIRANAEHQRLKDVPLRERELKISGLVLKDAASPGRDVYDRIGTFQLYGSGAYFSWMQDEWMDLFPDLSDDDGASHLVVFDRISYMREVVLI